MELVVTSLYIFMPGAFQRIGPADAKILVTEILKSVAVEQEKV